MNYPCILEFQRIVHTITNPRGAVYRIKRECLRGDELIWFKVGIHDLGGFAGEDFESPIVKNTDRTRAELNYLITSILGI